MNTPQTITYKFRCECPADFIRLQEHLGGGMFGVKVYQLTDLVDIPDRVVEFKSKLPLDALLRKFDEVEDAHIATQTLMRIEDYTGERIYDREIPKKVRRFGEGKLLRRVYICVLCNTTQEGYGNNAEPEAEGVCCDECNMNIVLPSRIAEIQLREMAKVNSAIGLCALKRDEALKATLSYLSAKSLKSGCNSVEVKTKDGHRIEVIVPKSLLKTKDKPVSPPPQSDEDLEKLFKDEDLKGQKKGKTKKERDAEAKAEETRLANIAREEERRRRREFEKEAWEKAKAKAQAKKK